MRKPVSITSAVLGVAGGLLLAAGIGTVAAEAAAVEVTAEQLLINQRISQAAVRRSNEALGLLGPVRPAGSTDQNPINPFSAIARGSGWPTSAYGDQSVTGAKIANQTVTATQIANSTITSTQLAANAVATANVADAAITRTKLSTDVQDNLPMTASVAINGTLVRGRGAVASFGPAGGLYTVEFNRDISQCTWTATISTDNGFPVDQTWLDTALDTGNNKRIFVRMKRYDGVNVVNGQNAFNMMVVC